MNDLHKLFQYSVNYFETSSQEEKALWVEKAICLIYELEDDDFIEEVILNEDEEIFMQNIQQYAFYKTNMKYHVGG